MYSKIFWASMYKKELEKCGVNFEDDNYIYIPKLRSTEPNAVSRKIWYMFLQLS